MTIEVRLQGCEERLRHYVEQRLLSHVGDLDRALRQVTVCVSRLPGQHYRCRMVAHPLPWASMVVEEQDGDVYAAIDRASSRLERTVRVAMRVSPVRGPGGAATPAGGAAATAG